MIIPVETRARLRPRHYMVLNLDAYDEECARRGLASIPAQAEVLGLSTSQASRLRRGVTHPGRRVVGELIHVFGRRAAMAMLDVEERAS